MFTVDVWYHDERTDKHGFYENEDFEHFNSAMEFFEEMVNKFGRTMTEYDIPERFHIRDAYQRKFVGCEERIIATIRHRKIEA